MIQQIVAKISLLPMVLGIGAMSLLGMGCAKHYPQGLYQAPNADKTPNYAQLANWAAHPAKKDPSDLLPDGLTRVASDTQATDVFFLYPTSLLGSERNQGVWNADLADADLNEDTDESSIQYQATAFNAAGRVYAPRYRQAHIRAFYSKDTASSRAALRLAYADVLAAFDYYLKNENKGKPFIIASHSQGAVHARQLLRERVENTPLQKRLVAAYLVGYPIPKNYFATLPACTTPEQTGCYCTWRTWEREYALRKGNEPNVVCTNPLLWTTKEGEYASRDTNKGGIVRPFNKVRPRITDAEVHQGFLLARKPKFPGSILFTRKNYHIGDINLYYVNTRENAVQRARAWQKQQRGN